MYVFGLGPFDVPMVYHMIEEILIVAIFVTIGIIASRIYTKKHSVRLWYFTLAFYVFAIDSTIHTLAHLFQYHQIIWFSLILRFLAYIVILVGITIREDNLHLIKRFCLIVIVLSFLFAFPLFHNMLPVFEHDRFVMWIPAAVFALLIATVYFYNHTKTHSRFALWMGIAFAVIAAANVILAVPSYIGDLIWIIGHIVRLFGVSLIPVALRVP